MPRSRASRNILSLAPAILLATILAAQAVSASAGDGRGAVRSSTVSTPIEVADTNASTDDRSVAVPTGWWVYTNSTAATINSLTSANGARLTDVEIHSIVSGTPRFTVRMVQNTGAYAAPGWWWFYGLTFGDVGAKLTANGARLIDIEPYDAGGGSIRYAVVMVKNAGSFARAWWYYSGVSAATVTANLSANGARLIDLDTYFVGATKYYAVVMVKQAGTDNKAWQWWLNQSAAGVNAKVAAFGGRIVDIERQPDGTFNVILLKNAGADAFAWWWYFGFPSTTDLLNYANQLGARPIDVETYVQGGVRRYAGVFIDNSNAATKRIRTIFAAKFLDASGNPTKGIFEAYLKQVGGSVQVDLNARRSAEVASSLKALHLLHTMRRIQAGTDSLGSAFIYYDYKTGTLEERKNACPDPSKETAANKRTDYNLEKGVDEMMRISDNRTTRGTVLRYGFTAINATADLIGMVGTQLRHNIGCAYYNFATGKIDPTNMRNDTTASDLARLYEGVWQSTAVGGVGRTEFLESANPGTGVSSALQTIINQEATSLGKSAATATSFGALVKSWSKGGSYNTCLPNSGGGCGQKVIIRSGAGIIQFPIKVSGATQYRTYVFGRFISDVPVPDWTATFMTPFEDAYSKAANELYREVVRSALATWP